MRNNFLRTSSFREERPISFATDKYRTMASPSSSSSFRDDFPLEKKHLSKGLPENMCERNGMEQLCSPGDKRADCRIRNADDEFAISFQKPSSRRNPKNLTEKNN